VELTDFLVDRWNLAADRVEVLQGGMNSQTWLVVADGVTVVAKAVDRSNTGFVPGLELAARLDRNGLATGAPLPSLDGRLAEPWGSLQLAVLKFVDGTALTRTPQDQAAIGTTLARVHEISREPAGDLEKWFGLITQFDAHLDLEPWIRPAVENALNGVRAVAARQQLTWAGLHADPSPDAFLRQASGEIALIDWGGWMLGPSSTTGPRRSCTPDKTSTWSAPTKPNAPTCRPTPSTASPPSSASVTRSRPPTSPGASPQTSKRA
jgi:phosphotransferase family enzyme